MKKRIVLFILLVSLVLAFAACDKKEKPNVPGENKVIDKIFIKPGFRITLTSEFVETPADDNQYVFETKDTVVIIYREDFHNFDGTEVDPTTFTTADYANLSINYWGLTESTVVMQGDLATYEYHATVEETELFYGAFIIKGSAAFWQVQFCCLAENAAAQRPTFLKYAKTVVAD